MPEPRDPLLKVLVIFRDTETAWFKRLGGAPGGRGPGAETTPGGPDVDGPAKATENNYARVGEGPRWTRTR